MNRDWTLAAACRGMNVEIFFADSRADIAAARAICARCPVRNDCADDALNTDGTYAYGVRAGLTGKQRDAMRRQMRAVA